MTTRAAAPTENYSRILVVDELRRRRSATRGELRHATGLSRGTVAAVIADLSARGLVSECPEDAPRVREGRGRPAVPIRLDTLSGAAVGVEFGHDHVRVAVANLSSVILAERFATLQVDHEPDVAFATASRAIDEVLVEIGLSRDAVVGAGVAVPAPVDSRTGVVGSSPIVPAWADLDIRSEAAERLGLGVEVDNDANLEALAEATAGAGRGHADLIYVKLSAGVGAGLVLAGQLCRGPAGFAGEIGHVHVRPDGPVCRCGARGCLETVASTDALLALLRPIHGQGLTLEELLELSHAGDDATVRVLQDTGRAVGRVLADICNALNLGLVVVGGDLSPAGAPLLSAIRQAIDRYALPAAATAVEVVHGTLFERATLLGALTLAIQETDRLPSAGLPAFSA